MNLDVWKVEKRKVKELVPHSRNPRKIEKEKLNKLKDRILSQGFRTPVCVDNDGVLLAGHQRCKALIDMGLGDLEIPVSIPPKELTEKQKQEILASDNLSFGEFDWEILNEDFDVEDLSEWGFDIETPKDIEINDLSNSIETYYKIEIECRDEAEQEDMFNKFQAEGLKCKLLTL